MIHPGLTSRQRDIPGYRVLSLMIPQTPSRESPGHVANESTTVTAPSKRHNTPADLDAAGESYRFFALAAPNASHRMVLLEMRVDANQDQHQTWGVDGGNKVKVREVAQLEGLGYDDEFTERLCEGADDGDRDEDEDGEEGGEGYVLVAALVGANRKAIYRVPLAAPRPRSRLKQAKTVPDDRSAGNGDGGDDAGETATEAANGSNGV